MRAGIVLTFAMLVAGCMPASFVRVDAVPATHALREQQSSVVDGSGLSRYTRQLLSRTTAAGTETVEARFRLAARSAGAPAPDRSLALAELALQSSLELERVAPDVSRDRALLAAWYAHDALIAIVAKPTAAFDGRAQVARSLYNVATARVLLRARELAQAAPLEITEAGRRFRVAVSDDDTVRWLRSLDELRVSWTLGVEGLRTRYQRDGIGVPLVGWQRARADDPAWRYGQEGLAIPLTGWLQFDREPDGGTHVHVVLRDSRRVATTCMSGRPAPLAADYTAPLALEWSRSPAALLARQGARGAEVAEKHRGFTLLEPYDPARIPLVLVHGLMSSPQSWRNLTNDVLGTPQLRERYQVWHYSYPTSEPFLLAAQRFRADLRALFDELHVPADGGVVVMGHSMGGLLAKSLVVESGPKLWDAVFDVPPSGLHAPAETRAALVDTLVLKPWPEIGRVVFLGTPHGGSELADAWWARVLEQFQRLPDAVRAQLARLSDSDAEHVRPAMRRWFTDGRATSIEALSPRQPLLRAFRDLPIVPGVAFDSIYGTAEGEGALASDGVVRAVDARLDGAASETALPIRHGDFDGPEAVDAMLRVLAGHAQSHAVAAPPTTCEAASF
jgi:hypothetical protein